MEKKIAPLDVRKNLRLALFKSLLVPVLMLAFFIAAPYWLNSKLRSQIMESTSSNSSLSPEERIQRQEKLASMDFQTVCLDCPPGLEKIHDGLARAGVVDNFEHLRWGLILSVVLVAGLSVALLAIYQLNIKARRSQNDLIRSYQAGWKIGMAAALLKVFLLIPLLAYGTFEFSVLLSDRYFPKLLLVIVLGGLFALWKSAAILLRKIPLEFKEPLCRAVSPEEAPELWRAVRYAAERLQTSPPDRILIGLQLNFYVTELAVHYDGGKAEGKTLFLSFPLLKQLSEEEVVAIIGHELGHFIGEDTRMTRDFYPLRLKVRETMIAMIQSGWVGWPSFQFLNYFSLRFGETEQFASRHRELLADQKAAALTSPSTAARALVRFQVSAEAFQRGLKAAIQNQTQNLFEIPLAVIVREQLAPDPAFWTRLFETKLPHPLDSHPPLHVRLEALGQKIGEEEARAIALDIPESAYDKWLAGHAGLFTSLASQAGEMVAKARTREVVAAANYQTDEGKKLLEQHFPEKKWQGKATTAPVLGALLAVPGLAFLIGAIYIGDSLGRIIFGGIGVLFVVIIVLIFKWYRGLELVLSADGLRHTSWKRPLRFEEVQKISARKSYSSLTLIFHLKSKQPGIAKTSLTPWQTRTVNLGLTCLNGKQLVIAQTIVNYFNRQINEQAGAPTGSGNKP